MACVSCCTINRRLLPVKGSYFFTLAAVASLLPFLSVYMKQLGLSPSETAILYGMMPFLGALVRPIVGAIADKLHQHKATLMICCVATGVLHACLLLVPPVTGNPPDVDVPPQVRIQCEKDRSQIEYCTDTRRLGKDCHVPATSLLNVTGGTTADPFLNSSECMLQCEFLLADDAQTNGICFLPVELTSKGEGGSEGEKHCVSGTWNTNGSGPELEFVLDGMNHSLTRYTFDKSSGQSLVCHFYSMSAFLFNGTSYQRLFCEKATDLQCQVQCERFSKGSLHTRCTEDKRDYRPKFGRTFQIFVCISLLANIAFAPIFSLIDAMTYDFLGEERGKWGKQRMWGTVGFALLGGTSGLVMDIYSIDKLSIDYTLAFVAFAVLQILTAIMVCRYQISGALSCSSMMSNIGSVLRRAEVLVLLVLVFAFGMFTGVIETFLFWHLQTLGASQLLMGLSLVMSCLPEIPVLFISGKVIQHLGHVKCLCIVCVAYGVRFTGYAFLGNPWYVLAIEPLHGITFGLMYAAASSYGSLITPPGMHGTIQGIIGGIHFGIGKGTGSVLGGQVFERFGPKITFIGCAIASGVLLLLYVGVQLCFLVRDIKQDKRRDLAERQTVQYKEDEDGSMLRYPVRQTTEELSPVSTTGSVDPERYPNGMVRDSLSSTPLIVETLAPSVSTV